MPARRVLMVAAVHLLAIAGCTTATRPASDFVTIDGPVTVLDNVRVFDGTGQPAREDQTIVIRDGVIADLGSRGSVPIPIDARVIDLTGRTVLPGYVMVHEHLFSTPDAGNKYVSTPGSFAPLYLAGGATTIRTAGSVLWEADRNATTAIRRGEMAGPDIDLTSPYLNTPTASSGSSESPYNRGRRMTARYADDGATSFKAYRGITREELRGVIAEAHARGLKVTGHLCAVTFAEAAQLGIDNLEHGLLAASDFVETKAPDVCPPSNEALGAVLRADGRATQRLIELLVERGVAVTSTLPVFETFIGTRTPAPQEAVELMSAKGRERYERHRAELAAKPEPVWLELLDREMQFERAFVGAGGLLLAGTDPTGRGGLVAGFSNQRAIQLLVEAGFSVPEAIRIATANGARYLGRDDRIGTIARGKQADLVVVDGNPEARLSALEKVETVFKRGIGYDARALRESVRGLVFER